MRKLILVLALAFSSVANAHGPHPVYPSRHYERNSWVAPLIIGGVVTYVLTRPAPQPVVVQQTVPQAPYGYHYENILDANCSRYRLVLVQN